MKKSVLRTAIVAAALATILSLGLIINASPIGQVLDKDSLFFKYALTAYNEDFTVSDTSHHAPVQTVTIHNDTLTVYYAIASYAPTYKSILDLKTGNLEITTWPRNGSAEQKDTLTATSDSQKEAYIENIQKMTGYIEIIKKGKPYLTWMPERPYLQETIDYLNAAKNELSSK